MEDRFVLLKIKREFTENEAVLSLLKIVKELQLEIGMLKSENEEALHHIKTLKCKVESLKFIDENESCSSAKSKKEWLKDELVASQHQQIKEMQAKLRTLKIDHEYWQNKYCTLAAEKLQLTV